MNTELKEKLEENVTCSICLERYKWPLTLSPCVHSYCKICLEIYTSKFLSSKPSSDEIKFPCPDCRTIITLPHTGIDGLTHNHKLQSIVDSLELHERLKQTELETQENEVKVKKTVQDEEAVTNSSSSSSTDNNDDKASDNNNNGRSQQIPTEEKVVGTSTNGGNNTSFSPPDAKVSSVPF